MNMLNNLLFSNPALMNIWMFLTDASKKKSTGILESVVTVAGAIVAILMVIMIVKSVLEYNALLDKIGIKMNNIKYNEYIPKENINELEKNK